MSDRGYEELFGKYSYLREFILFLSLIISVNIITDNTEHTTYTIIKIAAIIIHSDKIHFPYP